MKMDDTLASLIVKNTWKLPMHKDIQIIALEAALKHVRLEKRIMTIGGALNWARKMDEEGDINRV